MGRCWLVACVVAAFGCGSKEPKPKLEGPVDVRFGDCTPPGVAFFSGPRPQQFEAEAPAGARTIFAASHAPGRVGASVSAAPTVAVGQPNAQGDLDKVIIRRYIRRNLQKIQYCYEKELLANASLQGKVLVQFFIKPDGGVATASATGIDPNVSACVAAVIRAIEFPKPRGGGGVQVNYPFIFRPAGPDAPLPEAEDESGGTGTAMALDEDRAEGQYKMKKHDEDPQLARQQAIEQARAAGILGELRDQGGRYEPLRDYRPGLGTPLSFVEDALVACFRLQAKPYGVAVIDFDGKHLTAHGIDDPAFQACVAKIEAGADPLRCAVAFGPMPLDAAPALDVSATDITMDGAKLIDAAALADHLRGRLTAAVAKQAPVTLVGPLVIRPIAAAPMRLVNLAVTSALAAGDDPLLAVQRGGAWKLYRELELPVPPVPIGTGGAWGAVKPPPGDGVVDDERLELSLLVTSDGIWVGVSRVDEIQKLEGTDLAALEAALQEQKRSAFFADRDDIEIAGADDVPYERVVQVIDLAMKHGFTHWRLATPSTLAVQFQR